MEEVGRVSIRVVPDFTHFRKHMNRVLKQYDNRKLNWTVDVDTAGIDKLKGDFNNLAKDAKTAGKNMSKELTKSVKTASKDAGKKAKIDPSLNLDRFKRRYIGAINKVIDEAELTLPLNMGGEKERKRLEREAARILKGINELDPSAGNSLTQRKEVIKQYKDLVARVRDYNAEVLRSGILHEDESVRLRRVTQSHKDLAAGILAGKDRVAEWRRESQGFISDFQAIRRSAADANVEVDKVFLSNSKKTARSALRDYALGFRDISFEAQKAREESEKVLLDAWGKKSGIQNGRDQLRARGGITGALLGGVAGITALKGAAGLITGIGGAIGKLPGMFGDAGKQAGGFLDKVKGIGGALKPNFGTGIDLAGKAYIAAAAILLAAPVIGLVTSALLTLPGLIALVATPIAALTLGIDGLKKAAEVLKQPFENLKAVMSAKVEEQFTPVFEKLRNLFPTLEAALPTVTGGLAKIGDDIASFFTSDEGKSTIDDTIRGIGASLTQVAPGVRDFTAAIMGLAKEFVTGGALEGVGAWFVDTMADFRNWVNNADLTGMFKGLGDTLKIVVDWLGQIAETGLDFVSDPQKMNGFLATLENIGDFLADLVDLSSRLAGVWDAITFPMDQFSSGIDIISDAARSIPVVGDAWDWLLPDDWTVLNRKANEAGSAARMSFMNGLNETIDATNEAGLMIGSDMYSNLTSGASEAVQEIATELAGAGEKWQTQLEGSLDANQVQTAVAGQIQSQVGAAVNGSLQALVPLKEGLQNEINLALAPLGDIPGRLGTAFNNVGTIIGERLRSVPAIVSNALGSLPGVTALAMVPLNQEVQKGCDAALLTATFMAPKIIEPFRDLGGQMGQVGADMMNGLAIGIRDNASIASQAASVAAAAVLAAAKLAVDSESPSKDFMKLGGDLNAGMAIGIDKSGAGPISAIREVMQAIKDVFGTAEGLNLNFFMGEAATSMSNMATSSKEFRTNMTEAGTSPAITSGLDATQLDDVKREKAAIDLQIATLQAQKNATQDKAAKAGLTAEIDQLKIQKERLDLLKEESGLQEDRKTAIQQLSDTIATNITDMIKMPGDFAKATVNAAAQDLGISGSGAIPTIANWALDAGTNYIFNVNNMDDALQGQQAQQRSAALGVTG